MIIVSNNGKNWTVLFIGGASGVGKSNIAYALAKRCGANVMEADDVCQAVKAMTAVETHPAIHHWSTGVDWMDIGVDGNVDWLINVSKELSPALKAVADNHLESGVPVIIEGDFIHPELAASFDNPQVKAVFVREPDTGQIVENFLAREGGEPQEFRAAISASYGVWHSEICERLGIGVFESRPWDTIIKRLEAAGLG